MVDLNPLHYINKFNHMAGDNMASMMEFLGISDPAVDPDGIREIAKKWRALATAVDDSVKDAELALKDVTWEGKAAGAFSKRAKKTRTQATQMADALRDGADALDKFADEAHELLTELNVIILEIIEVEMASLALSVLTGGASAVIGSLAAGARFAKAMAVIGRIEHAGTAMARTIRALLEVIRGLSRALRALKEIKSIAKIGKLAGQGAKYAALDALLQDPSTFKDPKKLAETLALGAALGVGLGGLGKLLGKGLGKLKLNCSTLNRMRMRPGWDKLPASIRSALKKFVRDPIDVATGEMTLTQTDIELPGVLPLVLERTHLSSYRWGGWFGPSWASTLDQRLQVDEEGAIYAAADGARLCFPLPGPETHEPVRPDTPGSRLTLRFAPGPEGILQIEDPDTGLTHAFHSPVPTGQGATLDLPLQYIQDRNGNRITIEYDHDESDLPRAVVHSGGYHIVLDHHTELPRITGLRLVDPAQPDAPGTTVRTFTYDAAGQLTSEADSSGLALRYTYDAEGRVASWTDRNGTTYWYTYDEQGRVSETGGTGGALASTLSYDTTTRTTRVTDSLGHVRSYEHNEFCRLIREIDPLGNVTIQEWDSESRLVASTDALSRTTRITYDARGNVSGFNLPNGRDSTASFNALNLPTRVTEPGGAVWLHTYDDRGNLLATTDPLGATVRYAYDASGGLVQVTEAMGNHRTIRNDEAGLPIVVSDALGRRTELNRDTFGRVARAVDPLNRTVEFSWTAEGRPERRLNPDGTLESWSWDVSGSLLEHTNTLGHTQTYERMHFDLPQTRTDPDGTSYGFAYDTELRLTKVTAPSGQSWRYEYDAAGRLISETDFDNLCLTYEYDAAGQLLSRTKTSGDRVEFTRDTLGRVVQQQSLSGDTTLFAYDDAGRLIQATNPETDLRYDRDALGRVISEGVNGIAVHRAYDALGKCIQRTTPSGVTTSLEYDAEGQLTSLTSDTGRLDFSYDAGGRETVRRLGEDITLTQHWDVSDRLSVQSMPGSGQPLLHRSFTYRPDGFLTEVDDLLAGVQRFELDAEGRVAAVNSATGFEEYAYDGDGKMTRSAAGGSGDPAVHAYQGKRVSRVGRTAYEYDTDGRVVRKTKRLLSGGRRTWSYSWNSDNRLVAAVTPDGHHWRYTYDPLGRRTAKYRLTDAGETAETLSFRWEGTRLVEQQSSDGHVITWDYAPETHRPLAQTEYVPGSPHGRFHAIVTDAVGTPTELVSSDGEVARQEHTTLWGMTVLPSAPSASGPTTPLRFPGQYLDPETGLHYNCQRHYDPEAGRYLSPDPLGLEAAPDPYSYTVNPLAFLDPLGLQCTPGEPVEVTVRWLEGMPKQQFRMKAGELMKLSDAGVLFKAPNPVARDSSITNNYKAGLIRRVFDQFGSNNRAFAETLRSRILQRMNPDHVWELQLGGPDTAHNLHILDAFTNQRIGNQIWTQIRKLPDHTPLTMKIEGPP